MKLPHINFNAGAFGHTLVGRRAGRWLQTQLDGLGKAAVISAAQNNKMFLDYVPAEMKAHYKRAAEQYREMFPSFTDEEVYFWVPAYWRDIIESVDGGKEWGLRQIASVRAFFLGG